MELLTQITGWLWAPLVWLALCLGALLTVLTRGLQIRRLPDMVRQIWHGGSSTEGISSFQALVLTLSTRVGVGNIAGVATAIVAGGPGALFWMAVMGFLSGATAFVESTLAQIYKRKIDGQFRGGIPYYVEKGLGLRWLAIVAALVTTVLYGALAPGIQSHSIASSVESAFDVDPLITGAVITAVLGFVIFGGRKRIVAFAQSIVPFMAVGYVLAGVVVLAVNITEVPEMASLVITSAMGTHSVFGGILGAAIAWGVRRSLFSNVAGVGEGTYGSAAAQVSHPAKQGLVQCFSIYIDTLLVCMTTGFMILITGSYNVQPPEGQPLATNIPGVEAGPGWVQAAMDSTFVGAGGPFVAIALALFAFTTLVAFYYICETSLLYVTRRTRPALTAILKMALLMMTFFGALQSADLVWAIGDVGYASLAWVNMICLLLLARPALRALRDYDAQRRRGLDPQFDPVAAGVRNADFWTTPQPEARKDSAQR